MARFLYALGIPQVGQHMAQLLARHFETLADLQNASAEALQQIEEIGPEVAQSITAYLAEEKNREVLRKLRKRGLTLDNPHAKQGAQPLAGLTFVFTGSLERWTREEVKRRVEQLGGRATSSVSGETDYVVAGPGAGSKLDEAEEQNVPVLDEEEFVDLIEERQGDT